MVTVLVVGVGGAGLGLALSLTAVAAGNSAESVADPRAFRLLNRRRCPSHRPASAAVHRLARRGARVCLSATCALLLMMVANLAVADGATANGIRQTRVGGCLLLDFARPGSPVPGTSARYDQSGFWNPAGDPGNGLYDTSNGWSRQQGAPGRIAVDAGAKMVQGMNTVRLEVRPGDTIPGMPGERADVAYAGPTGIAPGRSEWWAWSTRTAADYRPSDWNALMDLHSTDGAFGTNVAISVGNATNMIMLAVSGGDLPNPKSLPAPLWRPLAKLVAGKRYDFELGVRWSSDRRVGWVEVWVNGVRVVRRTHAATLWRGLSAYPKLANYRSSGVANWTNVVYDAGFRHGPSRPAVHTCLKRLKTKR
jgi:hypothetical protein